MAYLSLASTAGAFARVSQQRFCLSWHVVAGTHMAVGAMHMAVGAIAPGALLLYAIYSSMSSIPLMRVFGGGVMMLGGHRYQKSK